MGIFFFFVFGVFLFVGCDIVVVVMVVRVVVLSIFVFLVFPVFVFFLVGSSSVGCVGFIASGFGLCLGRLPVVGVGGSVLVVLFISLIRWDLRCFVVGAWLDWRFGSGHGCVVSVLRISFMICLMLRSSSPVRANRRYICES